MPFRVLALIFAVAIIGAAPHMVHASPDVVSEVDELPDLAPQVVPEPVMVAWPDRGDAVRDYGPRSQSHGRAHSELVFRPPRALASR